MCRNECQSIKPVALPSDHPEPKSSCGCHGCVGVLPKALYKRLRYWGASVLYPEAFVEPAARPNVAFEALGGGPLNGSVNGLVDHRRELVASGRFVSWQPWASRSERYSKVLLDAVHNLATDSGILHAPSGFVPCTSPHCSLAFHDPPFAFGLYDIVWRQIL